MPPSLGVGVIAGLLLALSLFRWTIGRRRQASLQGRRERRNDVGALDAANPIIGPTTLKEAEDRIRVIDVHGDRHLVIRTRTLETVPGPAGPVEVERQRRLTLPGHGHVIAVSDTEFEIFHSHTRLRIDAAAGVAGVSDLAPCTTLPIDVLHLDERTT
jgi:hypothetical protein